MLTLGLLISWDETERRTRDRTGTLGGAKHLSAPAPEVRVRVLSLRMFLLQPGLHHSPPLPSKFSLCEAERRGADVSRSPTGLHRPLVCLPQLAVSRQGRVLILNRKGEVDPAVVICHRHVTELNMEMNNKNSTPFSNTSLLTPPSVLASPSLGGN